MGLFGRSTDASRHKTAERALTNRSWWEEPTLAAISMTVAVVGESHHQDALRRIAGGRGPFGVRQPVHVAHLLREPQNAHDSNAVRVEIEGELVGYLPRDLTPKWHEVINELQRAGLPASCRAILTGGWDRGAGDAGSVGVELLAQSPPRPAGPDEPFVPPGRASDVTFISGSEQVLGRVLGTDALLWTTAELHTTTKGVGVHLDGGLVGYADAEERLPYLPSLVAALENKGMPTTCLTRIERNKSGFSMLVSTRDCEPQTSAADEMAELKRLAQRRKDRARPQTGRWYCTRCRARWEDQVRAPDKWWTSVEGPHVCPKCESYAFTRPN